MNKNTDFYEAQQVNRNLMTYDETPIAETEEELIMAIKIIKKRRELSWAAHTGKGPGDTEKIY